MLKKIKKILLILFFINLSAFSQKHPVFYGGVEGYLFPQSENNVFAGISIGSQIYQFKFFAPEIGLDLYAGVVEQREINEGWPDATKLPDALMKQDFRASVLTLNPKFKFGNEDAFITFSPKYHIGRITGRARLYENRFDDGRFPLASNQTIKNRVAYWSFAVGFEGLNISDRSWFALSLNLTQLNARDAWGEIDFQDPNVKLSSMSRTSIGMGIRFYYNPFASEND
ncbi:hypothetical protein [Gramella sp. AN32]|uniref:Outer membrane protein beta-barrel domain-containing protein n=1 Tax=Christiangramia antarctica TaxID=2058158 RepID=A0ABW5X7Q8_9FLAO|nr:hypothetical protein [Gramella sp. AN32]MCM4155804.1 hypothetical protein [Gramella sp. AN32]